MGEARTANWKAPGSEQWTVPMDGGGGARVSPRQASHERSDAGLRECREAARRRRLDSSCAVPTAVSEVTEAFAARDILLAPIQGICRPAAPPSDFARIYIRGPA